MPSKFSEDFDEENSELMYPKELPPLAVFLSKKHKTGIVVPTDRTNFMNLYMSTVMLPNRVSVQFIKCDSKTFGSMFGDHLIYNADGDFYTCISYAGGERDPQYSKWLQGELLSVNVFGDAKSKADIAQKIFQSQLFNKENMDKDIPLEVNDCLLSSEKLLNTDLVEGYQRITARMLEDYRCSTGSRMIDLYANAKIRSKKDDEDHATECISNITPTDGIEESMVLVESSCKGKFHADVYTGEQADLFLEGRRKSKTTLNFLGTNIEIFANGDSITLDESESAKFVGRLFELSGMIPIRDGGSFRYVATGAYSLDRAYALYNIATAIGRVMGNEVHMNCTSLTNFDKFKQYDADTTSVTMSDVMSEAMKNLRIGYASFDKSGPYAKCHAFHFKCEEKYIKTVCIKLKENGIDHSLSKKDNCYVLYIPIGCSRNYFLEPQYKMMDVASAAKGLDVIMGRLQSKGDMTVSKKSDKTVDVDTSKLSSAMNEDEGYVSDDDQDSLSEKDLPVEEIATMKSLKADTVTIKDAVTEKAFAEKGSAESSSVTDIANAITMFGFDLFSKAKECFTKLDSNITQNDVLDVMLSLSLDFFTLMRNLNENTSLSEAERSATVCAMRRNVKTDALEKVLLKSNSLKVQDIFKHVNSKDIKLYVIYIFTTIISMFGFESFAKNVLFNASKCDIEAIVDIARSLNVPELSNILERFQECFRKIENGEYDIAIVFTINNNQKEYYIRCGEHFFYIEADKLTDEQKDQSSFCEVEEMATFGKSAKEKPSVESSQEKDNKVTSDLSESQSSPVDNAEVRVAI